LLPKGFSVFGFWVSVLSAFRFWVCVEVCLHFYLEHFKVFRSFVSAGCWFAGCSSSTVRGDILVIFPYLFSEPLASKQNKNNHGGGSNTHIISVINAFWLSACRKLCVKVRGALGMLFRLCFPDSRFLWHLVFPISRVHSTDL